MNAHVTTSLSAQQNLNRTAHLPIALPATTCRFPPSREYTSISSANLPYVSLPYPNLPSRSSLCALKSSQSAGIRHAMSNPAQQRCNSEIPATLLGAQRHTPSVTLLCTCHRHPKPSDDQDLTTRDIQSDFPHYSNPLARSPTRSVSTKPQRSSVVNQLITFSPTDLAPTHAHRKQHIAKPPEKLTDPTIQHQDRKPIHNTNNPVPEQEAPCELHSIPDPNPAGTTHNPSPPRIPAPIR